MSELFSKAYLKYAPKWVKVIRWREHASRYYQNKIFQMYAFFAPAFLYFVGYDTNPYPLLLIWYKPKTQEELDFLKKKWIVMKYNNPYVGRNWEIDQYHGQVPPLYDVWTRRNQYPEHYGDKYKTYARDVFCDSYKGGYP